MQFIIVTGMSGAGKSTVLKFFEDFGFFCVDNLPPVLLPKFVEVCAKAGSEIKKAAFGIDIRGGALFEELFEVLDSLEKERFNFQILFLESSDQVLMNRYKESRRIHPLAKNDRLISGITKEREVLDRVKKLSQYCIDTSYLMPAQLKKKLHDIYIEHKGFTNLMISVISFGFKYGVPEDSDLVFDVRFIPNPYYTDLRELTGNDAPVKTFVLESQPCGAFLDKLFDMINFLIPHYIAEGKNQLVVSIGCTGGKHRSVVIACELYSALQKNGHSAIISHRDLVRYARA